MKPTTAYLATLMACLAILPLQAQQPNGILVAPALLEQAATSYLGQAKAGGLVIGVVGANSTYLQGYGTTPSGSNVNAHTPFALGRLSTLFTAGLLAAQQQYGSLGIDNPLQSHLPDTVQVPRYREMVCSPEPVRQNAYAFPQQDDPALLNTVCTYNPDVPPACITLCQLTSHTSGLPAWPALKRINNWVGLSRYQLYSRLHTLQLKRAPGQQYQHSPMGFAILQAALEHNSGQPFSELMQTGLLQKLGLAGTGFMGIEPLAGYRKKQAAPAEAAPLFYAYNGMYSTANDMITYLRANLGITTGTLPYVLELCHQYRAATSKAKTGQTGMGMAWLIDQTLVKGHTVYWLHSSMQGHSAYIAFDKANRRGIIILSNNEVPVQGIGHRLLAALLQANEI